MAVPVGQLLSPDTRNTAQGGLLSSLVNFSNQRRAQEVQDDELARNALTRGIINAELGIDPNADFEDFLGFKESQAKQGLLGAQAGAAGAAAERSRAGVDRANFELGQMMQQAQDRDALQQLFGERVGDLTLDSGNAFLNLAAGERPDLHRAVGAAGLPFFGQEQQRDRAFERQGREFDTLLGQRVQQAEALGQVGLGFDLDRMLAQGNAGQLAADAALDRQKELDVFRGNRAQEAQTTATQAFSNLLGLNIDPSQLAGLSSGDVAQAAQLRNAQTMQGIQQIMELKKGLVNEEGQFRSEDAAAADLEYNKIIAEMSRQLISGGDGGQNIQTMLEQIMKGADHQGVIDRANAVAPSPNSPVTNMLPPEVQNIIKFFR